MTDLLRALGLVRQSRNPAAPSVVRPKRSSTSHRPSKSTRRSNSHTQSFAHLSGLSLAGGIETDDRADDAAVARSWDKAAARVAAPFAPGPAGTSSAARSWARAAAKFR